jgi:hypothetical protein
MLRLFEFGGMSKYIFGERLSVSLLLPWILRRIKGRKNDLKNFPCIVSLHGKIMVYYI